jgi:hypothetical protein
LTGKFASCCGSAGSKSAIDDEAGDTAGSGVEIDGEDEERFSAGGAVGELNACFSNTGDFVSAVTGNFVGDRYFGCGGAKQFGFGVCQSLADGIHGERTQ